LSNRDPALLILKSITLLHHKAGSLPLLRLINHINQFSSHRIIFFHLRSRKGLRRVVVLSAN
jgi:hypothetical protein